MRTSPFTWGNTAVPSGYVASGVIEAAPIDAAPIPRHSLRLSGTAHTPRLRGYSHCAAMVIAIPAAWVLIEHDPTVSTAVYGITMVVMYAVSSAYHLLPLEPEARRRLRQADHSMIYVFTGACYTPFCLFAVPGTTGIVLLVVAWLGAAAGVVIKVTSFARRPIVGSVLYVVLGCLGALTLPASAQVLDPAELALIGGTGLIYGLGVAILFTRRPDPIPHLFGYHEVWHGCVIVASALYFVAVWQLAGVGH